MTPTEIRRCLKAIYEDDTDNRSSLKRWVIKFCGCKTGKPTIVDEIRSGRSIATV